MKNSSWPISIEVSRAGREKIQIAEFGPRFTTNFSASVGGTEKVFFLSFKNCLLQTAPSLVFE